MEKTIKRWKYYLPNGNSTSNMKDAMKNLGVSKTRLIGMLKSGQVLRQEVPNSKLLKGYEITNGTN